MADYKPLWLFISLIALILSSTITRAQQLNLPLEEVAQKSSLIFVGTVEKKDSRLNDQRTMIFTDIYFKDFKVVHATGASVQKEAATIRLTHAGGELNGYSVEVSETPKLLAGHRYLIFMSDDGVRRENI